MRTEQYNIGFDSHLDLIVGGFGDTVKVLNLGAGSVFLRSDNPAIDIHNHNQYRDKEDSKVVRAKSDWIFDLTHPWPIPDDAYDIICAFHCIEHIPISKVLYVLQEARRVLRTCGLLIIEVPWMPGMVKELQGELPNYGIIKAMFGDDRYPGEQHRWGYYGPDLVALLHAAGYSRCVTKPGGSYANQQACLRVEASHSGEVNWTTELDTKLNTPVYPAESQPYDFGSTNSTAPGAALNLAP